MVFVAAAGAALVLIGLGALVAFGRTRASRLPASLPAAALSALAISLLSRALGAPDQLQVEILFGLGAVLLLLMAAFRMPWTGRLFMATLTVTGIAYLAAAAQATFAAPPSPAVLVLSTVLLLLEAAALALTLVFGFELADALTRPALDPGPPAGSHGYRPLVALQVPAYREPPELLRQTLEALARIDYPSYLVQVVVNNTPEPELWQPVQALCERLGPRFQFINLPSCSGFKAGALNAATRLLPPEVELVGIVDADYIVRPAFLRECVPHFADQEVAFLQTPQHYREWTDSAYLRGLFHAYRYFFDVTMVSRARTNAIIFGGTMGLIRRGVLEGIGGWAQWCITEDAEASLRILAAGWRSVYIHRPYGEGLMPLDFDGLRRQRFRWAFGGVQILRRHLALLLGLRRSRLTAAQRYHYLAGGLGWFADPVGAALAVFIFVSGLFMAAGHVLLLRQLMGALVALPLFLLVGSLVRLGWALKVSTGARWRDVPTALALMLALGWTVTQACLKALLKSEGVFLRTPKVKTPSRLGRALASTSVESVLAAAFGVLAVLVGLDGPRPVAFLMSALLLWQTAYWGSAPLASVMAQGITLTPSRRVFSSSPQNQGGRPRGSWGRTARRLGLAPLLAIGAFLVIVPAAATAPDQEPSVQSLLKEPLKLVQPSTAAAAAPSPSPAGSGGQAAQATGGATLSSHSFVSPTPAPVAGAVPAPAATPTPGTIPAPLPSQAQASPPAATTMQPTPPSTQPTPPSTQPTPQGSQTSHPTPR